MSTVKITTSQNIELDYDLASLGERIVSYLIDALIMIAYIFLMAIGLFSSSFSSMNESVVFVFLLPIFFYHLLSEIFLNGQSVGKRAMKIRVISLDGGSAGVSQYLLRWIFRLIDFSFTSNLCALITVAVSEKRQRLGDMIAATVVIKTVPRTTIHETLYVPSQLPEYQVSFPDVDKLSDTDMQLIKEVILNVRNSGNMMLALHAAEKIESTLGVSRGTMDPIHFLQTLLSDYNYLTSKS